MTYTTVKLRRVASMLNGGTPPSSSPEMWNGEVPFVTPPDLNGLDGASTGATSRSITTAGLAHSNLAPSGSVLLSTRAPIGHIGIASEPVAFNQGCRALLPLPGHHAKFLAYSLVAARSEMEARGLGTTFIELSSGALAEVEVPSPPSDVQGEIADFLDRETAKIDAFIAKNEQLIALLTERRAAVIAHAVTRGLDKSVDLRSTGSRWVRDIPNRWEYGNIRRFATMRTGHTPSRQRPEYWVDCDIPWFTLADVWRLRSGQRDMAETSEKISLLGLVNSSAELLPVGTVALSRTASVGFAGIMSVPMATSQDFWNWVPGPNLTSKYLWYQFQAMRSEFDRLMTGSTHRTIYKADAASLYIVVPPVDEQKSIVAYLESQIPKIDSAVGHAQRAIDLARERRAALISAAVTGKIDVGVDA